MVRYLTYFIGFIFFFSGALALVYEVTWTRMLSGELGSDALAVATLVAVFMGGLALGAHLASRWADQLLRPLKAYGFLEILLSSYVLLSPWLFKLFLPVFGLLGHQAADNIWLLSFLRLLLSILILLPPTLLMGATLPFLARFAAQNTQHSGQVTGLFYALNTLGAVIGCLLAGFVFLPLLPMSTTLYLVALGNLSLGGLVLLLSHRYESLSQARLETDPRASATANMPMPASGVGLPWVAAAVTLTGAAGLACQLVWTRVLVLVLGASAYAFTSVLAVFLLGLGAGALTSALLLKWIKKGLVYWFAGLSLAAAVAVYATSYQFALLPGWFIQGYEAGQAASLLGQFQTNILLSLLIILLPTWLMGMLFPLALQLVMTHREAAARNTGHIYFWNTLGAIVGALGVGFVLIPLAGLMPSLLLAASAFLVAACLVVFPLIKKLWYLPGLLALNLLLVGVYLAPPWKQHLMASGVSEYVEAYRGVLEEMSLEDFLEEATELLYYRDGLTATVTVERDKLSRNQDLYISTNGKIDGSSYLDMPTQKLSAHLPLLLHEKPESVAVIGMGTGVTVASASLHPEVEELVLVEIEPAMVEGAKLFADYNHRLHEMPQVDIKMTDGRLHIYLNPASYDIIISEPSNPWIAGIANLFTQEYYELGARSLKSEGIFAQWIQIYDMEIDNIRSVVATFQSVFPHSLAAITLNEADLLLVGSQQPLKLDTQKIQRRMSHPAISEDLAAEPVSIHQLEELLAHIWLTEKELQAFAQGARIHRDDYPFLMYEAPVSRYLETRRSNSKALGEAGKGVFPLLEENTYDREALLEAYQRQLPDYLRVFGD
ncbi:spermidine synthase [Marinospirillum celere]|uniref:Spermidine synthase n=1 Tax=Marinospirillum celere TaxID=1122252 RepID=A0A1I1HAC7_9GAMM|nr:fused MFS/spermidine synthase [Marinospirillum celere]SFC18958.1 spermidine synthase [Marinospirillum celere]